MLILLDLLGPIDDGLLATLLAAGIDLVVCKDVEDIGVFTAPSPVVAVVVAAVVVADTPITFKLEYEVKARLFPHSYLAVILF